MSDTIRWKESVTLSWEYQDREATLDELWKDWKDQDTSIVKPLIVLAKALRTQLEGYKQVEANLQDIIKSLIADLKECEDRYSALLSLFADIQRERDEAIKIKEAEKEILILEEMTKKADAVGDAQFVIGQLQAEIERLRKSIYDMTFVVESLVKERDVLRTRLEKCERELKHCLNLDNHNNIVRQKNEEIKSLEAENATLRKTIKAVREWPSIAGFCNPCRWGLQGLINTILDG